MSRRYRMLFAFLPMVAAVTALAAPLSPIDTMIQSERLFSTASVQGGMKAAFLAWLADDGVIFRPRPMDGKKLWASRDSVPGTLIWEPSYAEIAGSGDLGYTTGPWEYRPADKDEAISYGHFITVWRKQSNGWRVVADIGVQHDKPARGVGSGDLSKAPAPSAKGAKDAPGDIAELDRTFSDFTFTQGIAGAFAAQGAKDLRLNRDGFFPSKGRQPAQAAFDSVSGGLRFDPTGSGVATSHDLAYSYGISRWSSDGVTAPTDSGVYLHVWRRAPGKKWELALAVENPL